MAGSLPGGHHREPAVDQHPYPRHHPRAADLLRLPPRRRGYLALEAWAATQEADLPGLQVVATNPPAVALYERLRFVTQACNRFWVRS